MTREEAIDVLKAYLMFDKSSQQVAKALDMAIEALRTEPVHCEECKYLGIKDFVYGYCKKNMVGEVRPDDYCSYGERRRANK